jgi:hypothetical protein
LIVSFFTDTRITLIGEFVEMTEGEATPYVPELKKVAERAFYFE